MLVGESDSYAGAIGQPDRDDRIVARLSRNLLGGAGSSKLAPS